ncbi:MAG: FHA domain-containing protein [Deltaproteobacteria bacterium]|nr:FHA domain-containing protein [Deltaproteobacteria bacterium]
MDLLIEILEKFKVLLTTLVTLIPLAFIFRKQLGELISNITSIEIDPKKRRWKITFAQRIQREQKRATSIPRQITANHAMPAPVPATGGAKQSSRDMVIEAWGAVKQVVHDACVANKIPLASGMGIQEAVRRLGNANALSTDLVKLIDVVYELGQEVASDSSLRPEQEDAQAYWYLAYNAVNWLGLSVLTPKEPVPEATPPPPPRRATMVGGDFAPPRSGGPAAVLVGVGGPVRGQRFAVDKPYYRIGRGANNDLRIAGDEHVSNDHAYLRHEKGSLFLFDHDSLNGTFLNEQRVTGAPLMVRHGDRIRLGESVFEVSDSAAKAKIDKDQPDAPKDPSSSRSYVR